MASPGWAMICMICSQFVSAGASQDVIPSESARDITRAAPPADAPNSKPQVAAPIPSTDPAAPSRMPSVPRLPPGGGSVGHATAAIVGTPASMRPRPIA
eukprot:scaffold201606_cov36-Tisochrysis_lutea.AAC.1